MNLVLFSFQISLLKAIFEKEPTPSPSWIFAYSKSTKGDNFLHLGRAHGSSQQTDINTSEGLDAEKSLREGQHGDHPKSSIHVFHWDHTCIETEPSQSVLLVKTNSISHLPYPMGYCVLMCTHLMAECSALLTSRTFAGIAQNLHRDPDIQYNPDTFYEW